MKGSTAAMAASDAAGPQQHLSRAVFFLLLLLMLSSAVLFVVTFDKLSIFQPSLLSDLTNAYNGHTRELSILLHPEDHYRRAPKTITHHWNITRGYRSPDGVHKLVYLINGEFPGPTIEARSGDTLEIVISNHLEDEESVAVHWHGLHMRGANAMDGVVGITQEAIPAGADFTYRFDLSHTQAGTFWYHSHSALQRSDGLYGGLIIHEPAIDSTTEAKTYDYEQEQLLLIGDWYHRPAVEVQASYLTFTSNGHEPAPDSLLVNGLGAFNCSMAVRSRPVECKSVQIPSISLGLKATRLRIVNVGSMAGFNFSVPTSSMKVIQIDGGNTIVPATASEIGILYPGERMDIVTSTAGAESISVTLDSELFTMQNPALTSTQTFQIISPHKQRSHHAIRSSSPNDQTEQAPAMSFDLSAVRSSQVQAMSPTANQTLLIYTHIEMLAHYDHVPMAYMNRTNWIPQSPSLISLSREEWNEHQFMPEIQGNGEWVDIIVNNVDKDSGHPFHLHGHDFYVLTRHAFPRRAGYRTYNPYDLPADAELVYPKPNLVNPPLKDTIHIPRRGYVILRIRADNLGIWFFHCHILWHAGTGMAMGFVVT